MDFAGELSPYKLFFSVDHTARSIRLMRTAREMQLEIVLHYMQGDSDEPHCTLHETRQYRIPDVLADAPALDAHTKELGVLVVQNIMYPKADYLQAVPYIQQSVLTGWLEAIALMRKYAAVKWDEALEDYKEQMKELEDSMKEEQ